MIPYVLSFNEIDKSSLPYVGGKGANLGEMSKAGFPIPRGFCVTTATYRSILQTSNEIEDLFELLDPLKPDQLDSIRILGKQIRDHIESLTIPDNIWSAIVEEWKKTGIEAAYAIRSSATAEDLPTASFAGQQDTYLNVKGKEQILQAIQKCWASLFTDRAISYRMKNGFDHRSVFLSVVVQQMVFPEVSGIMFTAEPITGHRKTISIDASFGLGEALVSGIVSADLYQVRSGEIVKKQIADKKVAIYALPEGGTITKDLSKDKQKEQALPDEKIFELAKLGEEIEKHYGSEQDIEWGWVDEKLVILQSRPITSLYPLPDIQDNLKLQVFFSFGHQQMMTDAMKPLAISIMRRIFPFGKKDIGSESDVMLSAGGRLYINPTEVLYWKPAQKMMPLALSHVDELISNAITQFIQREQFQKNAIPNKQIVKKARQFVKSILMDTIKNILFRDSSDSIHRCNEYMETWVKKSKEELSQKSGSERIRWIQQSAGNLLLRLFLDIMPYPLSGIVASKMIRYLSKRWLGDDQAVDLLNKSLPGNVTSEMGLVLGDVADIARQYSEVIRYLEEAEDHSFYEGLNRIEGGDIFRKEFELFIHQYGMRCPGEIDITKLRWQEAPTMLVPSMLSHIQNLKLGEHREKFNNGRIEAEQAGQFILERVRKIRGGLMKQRWMSRLIKVYRDHMGIREHPKYMLVQHLNLYKQAILEEADQLVDQGVLQHRTDVFYLTLDEILMVMGNRFRGNLPELISLRKKEYKQYQKLTPPRVMTSEGEIITGRRRDIQAPAGSLIGTPVSPGVIEGYARVVLSPEKANLKPGEILIAPFTDPGWTTLFNSSQALVMEVGGLMTHGAVVAREYGIPAVVGVDDATKKIRDGQYIRVDGTQGYVQILDGYKDA
ncbi:phosphoenolpyruvate synthase [Hazenella coriacea]|uniref:Phosphoenolpyruvate synthase n=1 Tax=Hazenella coriacea TaxID=1179467 RepID=A0A4V2UV08_9BACL|nr:phosphoenolpyruvate synthase [Hazenella coriacea]TCS93947.1 phosphoenolpyruvate synthase [Hazenella coriacea]